MTAGRRFRYSRWDGTQAGFDLDADAVLDQVADDLLYHGDLSAALRRLMQSGFTTAEGQSVTGLRELLERIRRRRQEELDRYGVGGIYDDIAREVREIVEQERQALDRAQRGAGSAEATPRRDEAATAAAARRAQLDLLPPDLAGQVAALREYDFLSPQARERFERLLDDLRRELLAGRFNRVAAALGDLAPPDLQRFKDMLAALNRMLDQRARGEEPDFEGFMGRYGEFFPGRPETLDELLEQLAHQMAAMSALLNSMTPEQRAELEALSRQLLEDDLDLRWQLDQLGRHLRAQFPRAGWDRGYELGGVDPLGMVEAAELMERLGQLDQLEHLLRSAISPAELAEVDLDAVRALLDDETARALERLSQLGRLLEAQGLVEHREGRHDLTPRALRRIGQRALADLFGGVDKDRLGGHQTERSGAGQERTYESKPYEYGDPFHIELERTIRNAVSRAGAGVPVALDPLDFEVSRTESLTRTSTALLLDLSLSMPMRDNFLAAKKVAIALHALISSRFPQDHLSVVCFSRLARVVRPQDLPELSWDFVYGTNMQHALMLARRLLVRQPGTRQVIMVTDGEPTAHLLPGGDVFFDYPPARETLEVTLAEAARCTAEGIRINTFVLDATARLRAFVERLARINRGRVFLTTPETLGAYVLVDFLEQKRSLRRPA